MLNTSMTKLTWRWEPAAGTDVVAIKDIAETWFQTEVDGIWVADPIAYMRNVTSAIVNQYYSPGSELILVAKDTVSHAILGYLWVKRAQKALWSDQEMAVVQMVHVDLALGMRDRVKIISEMIVNWETWCYNFGVPIVCSTTMRGEQAGFLRLHEKFGYSVRGSYAYKRLGTTAAGLPIP